MNTYRNPVEWTGGIQVHHSVKEAEVIPLKTIDQMEKSNSLPLAA